MKRAFCALLGSLLFATLGCGSSGHGQSVPRLDADVESEVKGEVIDTAHAVHDVGGALDATKLDAPATIDLGMRFDGVVDLAPGDTVGPAVDAGSDSRPPLDLAVADTRRDTADTALVPVDARLDAAPLASGVAIMAVTLPSPRHEAAVFSDGNVVYVAGGLDDDSRVLFQIVRYSPTTGNLAILADVLPTPTYAAGVAWDGTAAYLFGGLGQNGVLRQIVRYVPGVGATILSAQLPRAAYNVGAVAAGSMIYAVGGQNGGSLGQILAYDPAADKLTISTAKLSVGVEAPSLFWDGTLVWILGGAVDTNSPNGAGTDAITTFNPATGELRSIGHLPYSVWDTPSFTDGKTYYLAGGSAGRTTGHTTIVGFDPSEKASIILPFEMPVQLNGRIATWVSSVGAAFLCGGSDYNTGDPSDKIIRIVP